MAEKIATRAAYGKALEELAVQEPNLVVLDADLSGSTMTKGFGAEHPDRFFDMGIAEANMVGVAAGLATCGKKPFVNSFAMFAAGRAWEQVRNSVAYPGLNVKVVGSHGGLSVGEDGATHQCIEDLAIMRAIPNMTVLCPCDGNEMKQAVKAHAAREKALEAAIRAMLGIGPKVHLVAPKSITRSEGKAVRVIDKRKLHD